jgi:trehalose synthase
LGARARETVREHFLMSRLLEDWIDFLATRDDARRRIGAADESKIAPRRSS